MTFEITATDDSAVDGGESVKLGFGTLPAKVSAASPDETVVSITDNDVAGVTVSPTTVTVAEGATAIYRVKLNTLPAGAVTVTINDPADNTDVTADTPSLSFDSTNWDTFQDVTVRAAEDGDAEDDTATVTHTVSGYGTVTTADSVSVTVTDNEPAVELSFGLAAYSVAEGATVTVTVALDVDPERTVVIPITTANQGGATGGDYMGVPADVTFNSGDTSMTFEITATDDSAVDGGESVKLGFGTLPAKVSAASPDETVVSITDNDVAGVTVSPTTVTVAEGATAIYRVKLNTLPAGAVTVTINDPADNTDVTADTPSLSFDSTNWDTFQDVTVRAAEDGDAEDDTATVTHTVSGYGTVTTADSVSVTVTDNEPAVELSFGLAAYSVAEGATVTVTVALDVDPERTVVIPITTANQGGATGGDYMGVPADVTFNSGDTSMTFEITATDDSAVDGGESVKLGFGTLPAKVSAASPDETVVSITDNDVAGVTVSPTTVTVAEGATAIYRVKLNTLPAGAVTVTINDPADNTDVTADTPSLSFDSTNWDTFQDVTVRAAEDGDAEDDTATVTHTVSGYGTVTTADSVSVTVTDNEPAVELSFGLAAYSVAEGATVTVTVALDVDPERTVVIPITTANQGGATGGDYMGVPADVTFNSGDTSMTFEITATDDSAVDGGESVKLGFGTLPAKVSAASPDETVVSITDNDVAGVTVSFAASTYTVAEGDSVTVTVDLDKDPGHTVSIPITATNGGGASNTDYSGVPPTVTFNSGETSKTFSFTATQDTADDDGERVELAFGPLPTGVGASSPSSTTVRITDDDAPAAASPILGGPWEVASGQCSEGTAVTSGVLQGTISMTGEYAFFGVIQDPHVAMSVWIRGLAGPLGSLSDPRVLGYRNYHDNFRTGTTYGLHLTQPNGWKWYPVNSTRWKLWCLAVASGDGGVGSFEVKVEVNTDPSLSGGPDGYHGDVAGDTTTEWSASLSFAHSQFMGDDNAPGSDVDWFRVNLDAAVDYRVTAVPLHQVAARHRLNSPIVTGVYDVSGSPMLGTSSTGSGPPAVSYFTPTSDGVYFVGVSTDGTDPDGLYLLCVEEVEKPDQRGRCGP